MTQHSRDAQRFQFFFLDCYNDNKRVLLWCSNTCYKFLYMKVYGILFFEMAIWSQDDQTTSLSVPFGLLSGLRMYGGSKRMST